MTVSAQWAVTMPAVNISTCGVWFALDLCLFPPKLAARRYFRPWQTLFQQYWCLAPACCHTLPHTALNVRDEIPGCTGMRADVAHTFTRHARRVPDQQCCLLPT